MINMKTALQTSARYVDHIQMCHFFLIVGTTLTIPAKMPNHTPHPHAQFIFCLFMDGESAYNGNQAQDEDRNRTFDITLKQLSDLCEIPQRSEAIPKETKENSYINLPYVLFLASFRGYRESTGFTHGNHCQNRSASK